MNQAWDACGGDIALTELITIDRTDQILPSAFDVTGLVADTTSAALLAVAELHAMRNGSSVLPVELDVANACAAFGSERHIQTVGWELPPTWDPIAGDYQTSDGWIRLHTNYSYHRDAVCEVLGVAAERDLVAAEVATWSSLELEAAVVNNNGAAAALRTETDWASSTPGQAVAAEPLVSSRTASSTAPLDLPPSERPLAGVRVLDLTRVIAGPTATGFLAGYGADVLRIDPPGFEEVPLVLPIVTAGKRCASLDLKTEAGRERFASLVASAHVLVTSLRGDALDRLGFDQAALWNLNPGLVVARNAAYGWSGPNAARRGFDSLVQMSTGIADTGRTLSGAEKPTPLPVQALDYGSGYLMAAAVIRGITQRLDTGFGSEHKVSLARTARWLADRPRPTERPPALDPTPYLESATTAWGPIVRVKALAGIPGITPTFDFEPGNLGRHQPHWTTE